MLRGGRDPIAIRGARLRPWTGRLGELPASLLGHPGNYVAARYERQQRRSPVAVQPTDRTPVAPDPSNRRNAAQAAALASFATHQARTNLGKPSAAH
ncbi:MULTISPECIES: hypothetical protein [unclassified Pseudonocardia]|uniref:hypothetical protein n=1 Tax=unclassified Pseudonocardia TaxID=2619320 RepID=UPI001CF6B484|nr:MULTISPECIES: hypothetical protein [unclassified Pseudonocardia]